MKVIDKIPEKSLLFVEHDFLNSKPVYEVYYCETKMYQNRGNFNEALSTWCNITSEIK